MAIIFVGMVYMCISLLYIIFIIAFMIKMTLIVFNPIIAEMAIISVIPVIMNNCFYGYGHYGSKGHNTCYG